MLTDPAPDVPASIRQNKRPNIVFLIADDHRHSDINAVHPGLVQTPTFDQLAAEGTAFSNTHIMGGWHRAVCAPSRACVLTGGSVFKAVKDEPEPRFDNVMKNHCDIHPSMASMPETLRADGYHTYGIGKWHNDRERFKAGFCDGDALFFGGMSIQDRIPLHHFNLEGDYPAETAVITDKHATERFCDAGVRFIEEYEGEDPFFLYLAFTSPHDPRTAPKDFADLYDAEEIPLPKNFMPVHPFDNGEMHVRDEGLARLPRDPYEVCQHIADYYAMISHMDAEIGRVMEALRRRGIDENTVVVYTSDHGLAVGQHGLMGKQNLYDHSVRIPFLIKGPNVPKGTRVDALTCQMDLFPTLCELAGTPIPPTVNGKSLVPLMTGQCTTLYESVFSVYKDLQRMVKKGGWKLIRYFYSETSQSGSENLQLFDLERDPWEIRNLAADPEYSGVVKELLQELRHWQERSHDPALH